MHCELSSLVACQALVKSRALKRKKRGIERWDEAFFFPFGIFSGSFVRQTAQNIPVPLLGKSRQMRRKDFPKRKK